MFTNLNNQKVYKQRLHLSINKDFKKFIIVNFKQGKEGNMQTFQDRLLQRMKELNLKSIDIVRGINSSRATVSQWVRGIAMPKATTAMELAKFLQCELTWLLYGEKGIPKQPHVDILEDKKDKEITHHEVERFDLNLSAGQGTAAWIVRERDDDPLLFRRAWFKAKNLNPDNLKGLYVRGDSMIPYLYDKDTVIVDVDDTEIVDGKVYAILFKNRLYVKELRNFEDGVKIISLNPDYDEMQATEEDFKNNSFHVLGKVIWRGG